MILLTDEKILMSIMGYTMIKAGDDLMPQFKSIAKAQLKKVVEWGREGCTEHKHPIMILGMVEDVDVMHNDCEECWQSLLDEVKDET